MTIDRRRAALWGLLIGSMLISSYRMWPGGSPAGGTTTTTAPTTSSTAAPAAATVAAAPKAPPLTPSELSAWRGGLGNGRRDPFFTIAELEAANRPTPVAQRPDAPPTEYALKLVMMIGGEGRALIDGKVVKVGDVLGDEQVTEIVPDAVVLERAGRRRRLQVATGGSSGVQIQTERTP